MNKFIAYINDDRFQIKNNKVIEFVSNGIINGRIVNKNDFINDYKKYVKNNNIFASVITILLDSDIYESDIIYYTSIFEDLNFNKIILESTKKYLENNTLIYNKDLYVVFHDCKYYYIYPKLLKEFLNIKKIKRIKVISNKNIIESDNCKFYYYANSNNYFIKED